MSKKKRTSIWNFKVILLFILIPLFTGVILASFIPQPVIVTIEIQDVIDNRMSSWMMEQLDYVRSHPEVRAVVLLLNCPGGTINDTELIYLELINLRKTMPVVTMVEGLSASGAFYLSVGTDFIFSNPSALVGNVGVIGFLPPIPMVFEETISTGPYKMWGTPRDMYIRQIDMMKESYLQVVLLGRSKKLKMTGTEILRGEIYPANEALRRGLIDEIGPRSASIEKAARLAHITNYDILSLHDAVQKEWEDEEPSFFILDENGISTGFPHDPGFYYLYIPNYWGTP
ncbi:MAG TPA: S49 family peptidase [Anaerolineae bacterium]|nr:S49 family peptidase [Anaerolineae bacterium]